ncbi:hypothetical protein V6Z11_D10G274800 [Gossypium hirsutum]
MIHPLKNKRWNREIKKSAFFLSRKLYFLKENLGIIFLESGNQFKGEKRCALPLEATETTREGKTSKYLTDQRHTTEISLSCYAPFRSDELHAFVALFSCFPARFILFGLIMSLIV